MISRRILVFLTARVNFSQLTGFQNFDDDSLVVLGVNAFVHFGVLASANLLNDFVVVLRSD